MPKFSIVLPIYNRENMIGEVIESIIAQGNSDWELILVDDCSTDESFKVCSKYAEQDSRISLHKNETNKGEAFSRHFGNTLAKGEIIVVADSDDISYPNRLNVIGENFDKNPELSIFYTNADLHYLDTEEVITRWFQPFNEELLRYIDFIPNPASSYKRKAYFEIDGYDEELKIGCDYDLWLQFLDKKMSFGSDARKTVKMSIHNGSIRKELANKHKGFIDIIRQKHGLLIPNYNRTKKLANKETFARFIKPGKIEVWFR